MRPDQTFTIKVDGSTLSTGDLASSDDFEKPLTPPATIDDPSDIKPSDWVENEEMVDPSDTRPEDWDERPKIKV